MRMKRILAPTILAGVAAAMLIQLPAAIADRTAAYDLLDPIIDIKAILFKSFVDESKLDEARMQQDMIEAMLESLGDPHTVFIPPQDEAEFEKELKGTYVGIGCEVNIVDDHLTIISPMDGSPALEAGVMAGDVVLEIEGESTFKMPVSECITRLVGEPGTQVKVRVRHVDGMEEDLTITRRQIVTRTVKGLRRMGERWTYCIDDALNLAYLRLTQFNGATVEELKEALDDLQREGMNGLVLDLRDNPGGGLASAVQTADLFLDEGTIVRVKPRRRNEETFNAHRPGTLPAFPMIVLVNSHSASASEIVAGALQENGRAKVLGTRTYGKGSVQEVRELDYNRGILKFTSAHYHLKSGRNINRSTDSTVWGVDPDPGFVVPISDEQYRDMFLARRDHDVIRTGDRSPQSECADAAWVRENLKDEQLALAVEALKEYVGTGAWPHVGEAQPDTVVFAQELQRAIDRRGELMDVLGQLEKRIAELDTLAAKVGTPPLLPPDLDLTGGTLSVRDKHGNIIGEFIIEGGNPELALKSLRLKSADAPQ